MNQYTFPASEFYVDQEMVLCVLGGFFPLPIDIGQVQVLLSHCGQALECTLPPWTKTTSKGELLFKVNAWIKVSRSNSALGLKPCLRFGLLHVHGSWWTTKENNLAQSQSRFLFSSIIFHLPFKIISLLLYSRVCFIFTCKFCSSKKRLVFYLNNLLSFRLNNICVLSR